jgi:methylenetetrahydrofolate--tRNA-(uracil-5-)-methyltransferase
MAGIMTAAELAGRDIAQPPPTTAFGALLGHITGNANPQDYQPMNVNFGLFAPLEENVHKKSRKAAMTSRARADLASWVSSHQVEV